MARAETADHKPGVPGWMVSFGDMMTLILTFFILLVSLSTQQQNGLLARGLGSFVVAVRSFGLDGVLGDQQKLEIFNEFRARFNLPPEEDLERREQHSNAANLELIRAQVARGLAPHDELNQPAVALFEPDSAALTEDARRYLDLLAATLRPGRGQVLLLEGHARDAGPAHGGDDRLLAFLRAQAVRDYLIEERGFRAHRVEARAWLEDLEDSSLGGRSVDARLITPDRD